MEKHGEEIFMEESVRFKNAAKEKFQKNDWKTFQGTSEDSRNHCLFWPFYCLHETYWTIWTSHAYLLRRTMPRL